AVSLHRFAAAKPQLEKLLRHANLQVSRAAAEGLGRIGDPSSVKALLQVLDGRHTDARVWEHSITFALIELQATDQALEHLANSASQHFNSGQAESATSTETSLPGGVGVSNTQAKRIAMQVIDQLSASQRLSVDMLLEGLGSDDKSYRHVASQIMAQHPEW